MTASVVNQIEDRGARALGIPGFGIAIPLVAGLYGTLGPGELTWWLGQAWFIGLAAAIWHGNRWLLFRQREHLDWFGQPARKLMLLLFAIVCYTAPLTVGWLAAWYRVGMQAPVDWAAVQTVTLANVICVVFVTHAYETVFLIRDRESDLVRLARLEQARSQAQLDALRAQVDPHFLFNTLNALTWLIETDPARARAFNETLARVYRYVLAQRTSDLVRLDEELTFARDYGSLLGIRFGESLRIRWTGAPDPSRSTVPMSLQLLLENAVKHNEVSQQHPLGVHVEICDDRVRVSNRVQPRAAALPSVGIGLENLATRVTLATSKSLEIKRSQDRFIVSVPLVTPEEPCAT